jgi:hypothetical protein
VSERLSDSGDGALEYSLSSDGEGLRLRISIARAHGFIDPINGLVTGLENLWESGDEWFIIGLFFGVGVLLS